MTPSADDRLHSNALEAELERCLPHSSDPSKAPLNRAIHDAVFPAGKRMRPRLTLLTADAAGAPRDAALQAACAVEFFHACSLILDDLPCMDDARTRRGKPALHRTHGEATAILAAMALFNQSWRLLAEVGAGHPSIQQALIHETSICIGEQGIVGGQFLDLAVRGSQMDASDPLLKTTALLRLSLMSGALPGQLSQPQPDALGRFGDSLGVAYQRLDNLLDEFGDSRLMGKDSGQDRRHRSNLKLQARSDIIEEFSDEIERLRRALPVTDASDRLLRGATRIIDTLDAMLAPEMAAVSGKNMK